MHFSFTRPLLPFPLLIFLIGVLSVIPLLPLTAMEAPDVPGTEAAPPPTIAPFDRSLLKNPGKACEAVLGALKSENVHHLIELSTHEQQKFFRNLLKEGSNSDTWQKYFLPKKQLLVKSQSVSDLRQGLSSDEVFGKVGGDRSIAFVITLMRSGDLFYFKDLARMELRYLIGRPRWK
jgi:hypothetical protein